MGRGREQQLRWMQPRKGAAPGARVGGSCAGAACEGGPYDVPRWPPLRRRCRWALQALIAAILQGILFFNVVLMLSCNLVPTAFKQKPMFQVLYWSNEDNMVAWWSFHTWFWCVQKGRILHRCLLGCLCALRLYWCLAKCACFRRACKQGL